MQHLAGLRALHIAQRTQIDLAQQGVGIHVVRVLRDLVLRRVHRVLDAPDPEVEFGKAVLQQDRVGIGVQRQLVLFHRLGRILLTAGVYRHLLI